MRNFGVSFFEVLCARSVSGFTGTVLIAVLNTLLSSLDYTSCVQKISLLTERENRSGKYWPEVVAVQTESQYSVTLGYGFGKQIHDFDRVQNPTKKEPMTLEFTLRLPSNIIAELRAEPHTHIQKQRKPIS